MRISRCAFWFCKPRICELRISWDNAAMLLIACILRDSSQKSCLNSPLNLGKIPAFRSESSVFCTFSQLFGSIGGILSRRAAHCLLEILAEKRCTGKIKLYAHLLHIIQSTLKQCLGFEYHIVAYPLASITPACL